MTAMQPALTPEEWALLASDDRGSTVWRDGIYAVRLHRDRVRIGGGDIDGLIDIERAQASMVMALANAVAVDGFTHEHVTDLIDAANLFGDATGDDAEQAWHTRFMSLSRRIAALLPPQPSTEPTT